MKFSQIRKLVDVLVEELYDGYYNISNPPFIDINISQSSLIQLRVEVEKQYPDLKPFMKSSSSINALPEGVMSQINMQNCIINFKLIKE